jgi:ABC-type glycerol-3-phosphate transport system substrate-binding protein
MRKWIALLLSVFLMAGLLAGCTGNNNSGASGNVETATGDNGGAANQSVETGEVIDDGSEKLTISFMPESWGGGKWRDDHPTIKYLNEKFNIEMNVMWTDGPTYKDKLNVMAASGSLPDMYRITSDNFAKWQNEGVFLDLAPYLDQYPNLAKAFPEELWNRLNPQGKIYGFPNWGQEVRDSYQIRADWIRNVGLEMPNEDTFNVDDFYAIMKAFAQGDPDKNGKNDTVGFTTDQELGANASQLKAAFGLANEWKMEDGRLITVYVQSEEQKAFLSYLRKMYEEGVLDPEFYSKKGVNVYEMFQASKAGIFNHHPLGLRMDNKKLKEIDPNAELVQLAPPIGPDGLRGNAAGLLGANKIVINGKIEPKKRERLLKLLDWWVTDEGTNIMRNGIEGEHYTKEADGTYKATPLNDTDLPRIMNNWFFWRADPNFFIHIWSPKEEAEFDRKFNENSAKHPWRNESEGLTIYSETFTKSWESLRLAFLEAQLKIIIGREPVDSIDKAIEEWKATGGDKIIQEVNDAYSKLKGE